MRIHGICLAKNEGDLIEYSLRDKLLWCDFIYVYDNGSTDQTWEIATRCAAEEPERIFLLGSSPKPFNDGLRGEVFEAYRTRAQPGDWWCRADVDEFYVDDPKQFLARVPARHHVVWSMHIQYLFTELDAERLRPGTPMRIPQDFPRHYVANYSEPRFFRHRNGLTWNEGAAWPTHMGVATPRRIRVRHYQFRSPAQIEVRLQTRRDAAAAGWQHFQHSQAASWREKIEKSSDLHYDKGDGQFILDEEAAPRHLEPAHHRLLKLAMHGFGVWP